METTNTSLHAQAKRIEPATDIVVICATMLYLNSHEDVLSQIAAKHKDCEVVFIAAAPQNLPDVIADKDFLTAVNAAYKRIMRHFIKCHFAWAAAKKLLAPKFAEMMIDKDHHSKGFLAITEDPAWQHPMYVEYLKNLKAATDWKRCETYKSNM